MRACAETGPTSRDRRPSSSKVRTRHGSRCMTEPNDATAICLAMQIGFRYSREDLGRFPFHQRRPELGNPIASPADHAIAPHEATDPGRVEKGGEPGNSVPRAGCHAVRHMDHGRASAICQRLFDRAEMARCAGLTTIATTLSRRVGRRHCARLDALAKANRAKGRRRLVAPRACEPWSSRKWWKSVCSVAGRRSIPRIRGGWEHYQRVSRTSAVAVSLAAMLRSAGTAGLRAVIS